MRHHVCERGGRPLVHHPRMIVWGVDVDALGAGFSVELRGADWRVGLDRRAYRAPERPTYTIGVLIHGRRS